MSETDPENFRTWDAWHKIHQPFEVGWWRDAIINKGHSVDDGAFKKTWDEVKEFVKPVGDILDIGCGPRPPFAPCTVIEPLAEQYREFVPARWWLGVTAYSSPAESLIPGISFDTIVCWNCIDHAVGWREILDNMVKYGRPGARFAVATDFFAPFIGHPGFERETFMAEIDKRFNIHDKREPFGRQLALLMTAKK